jgi:acyl-CoA synthetase (AMP-forming)/AMP-acid ligase II/acyl carrier protein
MDTLVELLQHRARSSPPDLGHCYLLDGEVSGPREELSHRALDRRARVIAAELQRHAEPGDRALLLYPPGLEYLAGFFGCLYAGVVAVPAYPPEPSRLARTLPRMQAILADADATVVLTTGALRASIEQAASERRARPPRWIATDTLDEGAAAAWREPALSGDSLAFLQYTSGSTSSPKGVMITHRNLLHTLDDMGVDWGHDERSVLVSWLPVFHDLGLIYGLLQPVHGGFRGVVFSPIAFLQRPIRWLQAISRLGGTHSAAPNFAFDLCVRKSTEQDRAGLDLARWKVALNAAEPVRAETIERFTRTFAPCGLPASTVTPGYGLAEATLKVSTVRGADLPRVLRADPAALERGRVVPAADGGARPLVGCGRPALEASIEIVDPETRQRLPGGTIGEIWVASRSVAAGYWNRPDASREVFGATIAGEGTAFLRTGDLGFVLDGELFLTGRRKDLLIIDGKNHYPQDLELTAERAHPALRPGCGAAFAVEEGGEERVVLVCEVDPRADDPAAVAARVRAAIHAEHQLPLLALVFLEPGAIFKTSSGKIQRSACKAAFLSGQLARWYSWRNTMADTKETKPRTQDAIERWLYTEIGKTLNLHPSDIEPRHSLEDLGLKSSEIVSLTAHLSDWLGRRLEQNALSEANTIPEIAKALAG